MITIKNISVKTTFKVGIGGLKVSRKVYHQLKEMEKNDITFDGTSDRYPEANQWLVENVRLADCHDVEYEIKSLI